MVKEYNEDLVSVIVPVYNVKKYLRKCVNSILHQTYKKIELIIVDDGSIDGSSELCDKLQMEHKVITVVHKKNGGLSDARNCGIEKAKGKYICFVDSDDIVANDYIESMLKNMSQLVKISSCGYCHLYDSGQQMKINYEGIDCFYKGIEAQKYLNIIGYFNVSACNKLFEKDLFKDIQFPVGKKSEDWYIMYRLIEKAGGIYYNSDVKYFYRQRVGSITKSVNVNTEAIDAAKEVFVYYEEKKWYDAIPYAAQSLAFAYIGVYNAYLCGSNDNNRMKKIRKKVINLKKELTFDELSKVRKAQLLLFLNSKTIYDIAFKIFNLKRKSR